MMSNQDVARTMSTFAQEVLSTLHYLPGSVVLSQAVQAALEKRFREGCNALLDQLAEGGEAGVVFGEEDHDDFVQMLLRFNDSMHKGTTTHNLKVLGRLIIGLKADGSFHFDEFNTLAGTLEGLCLKELELLATMYRLSLKHQEDGEFWAALRDELGYSQDRPDHELIARLNALSRTGFVVSLSGFGTLIYAPAPALRRLAKLAGWPTARANSPAGRSSAG